MDSMSVIMDKITTYPYGSVPQAETLMRAIGEPSPEHLPFLLSRMADSEIWNKQFKSTLDRLMDESFKPTSEHLYSLTQISKGNYENRIGEQPSPIRNKAITLIGRMDRGIAASLIPCLLRWSRGPGNRFYDAEGALLSRLDLR